MKRMISELDRILRGHATRLPELRAGTIRIPIVTICLAIVAMGAVYGVCMGIFAVVNRDDPQPMQILASVVKVPMLFYLTLLVTFPSLYVFNALVGSRLDLGAVFRLIIASLAVTLAVLASFGPIAVFFSFTTQSYSFMLIMHVVIFAVAGVLGLAFLLQTLHRLTVASSIIDTTDERLPIVDAPLTTEPDVDAPPTTEPDADGAPVVPPSSIEPSPLERLEGYVLGNHVKAVFRIWIIVFGLVGAQMAWVMRPFIGHPGMSFTWFRERDSNFFEAVWRNLVLLFTGG